MAESKSASAGTSMTKQEQALVDTAFALERLLKEASAGARRSWWDMAKVAYQVHQQRAWELLGYDTLEEFLGQPEIELSRRGFFRAVQEWRDLVEVKQIPVETLQAIEPSKAHEVRPAIMSGSVKVEQALSDAQELSYRDVVEKYRPSKVAKHEQSPNGSTPLAAEDEPERVRCPCCRQWTTEDEIPEKYRKGDLR